MISSIQSLRAIAAYLVVFVHIAVLLRPLGLDTVAPIGGAGVDLFFVISGFIMVRTTTRPGGVAPIAFLKNRIARVVPSYWLLTLLVFALAVAAPSLFVGTEATVVTLAKSLGFIPYQRADGLVRPLLFVGWSLNYEMLFYLVFAAALAVRHRVPQVTVTVALLLVLVWGGAALHPRSAAAAFYTSPIMLEFAFGMVLARVYPRFSENPRIVPIAWAVVVVGAAGLLGGGGLAAMGGAMVTGPLFTGLAATLVLGGALQLERVGGWPALRRLSHMGDASYALYLTHPLVTVAVTKLAARAGLITPVLAPFLVLAAFGLASIVALFYYRWIERPLSAAARRWLDPAERQRAGGI